MQFCTSLTADRFLDEKKDCTVRALALAGGVKYPAAHAVLAGLGRLNKKSFRFWEAAQVLKFSERIELSRRRLQTVLPELKKGRYIVSVAGHVFAVVDGTIYDGDPGLKRIVRRVYEVPDLTKRPVDVNLVAGC